MCVCIRHDWRGPVLELFVEVIREPIRLPPAPGAMAGAWLGPGPGWDQGQGRDQGRAGARTGLGWGQDRNGRAGTTAVVSYLSPRVLRPYMRGAVQLYTLRRVVEPLPELLSRVADAGYEGVEFAGLDQLGLRPVAEALGKTELEPVGAHVTHDRLQAERAEVVRELRTIGCERVVIPAVHEEHFGDADSVNRMATRLSALGGRLDADGRQLLYHNHEYEFGDLPVDAGQATERDAFDLFVERAGDGLAFEFDVGWAVAAGRDPAAVLSRLDGQVPLVHLKDVDEDGQPVEPGEGIVDLIACAEAAREAGAEWLVYEHDGPTDPLASMRRGARVLDDLLI